MSKNVGILFPHQLFANHEILIVCDEIILVEEHLFFNEFNFHKQKIAFHRASMKAIAWKYKEANINVAYIDAKDHRSDIRQLLESLDKKDVHQVYFINPTDNWLEQRIQKKARELSLAIHEFENPLFLNNRSELSKFFRSDKMSFFQTSFYKQERKRLNLLLESNGGPKGGKWTFDTENRKKYPKSTIPPPIIFPIADGHWKEALEYVKTNFPNNPGMLHKDPLYAYTSEQAEHWLDDFLAHRFHQFGDYEDAITRDNYILHHSVLTPMLNTGLLSPDMILDNAIAYAEENDVPINSLEGFVRQIIGWREFIRGMYECKGSFARTRNFWEVKRKIPPSFYDGTTGIAPVDATIKKVLKTGYCHHIERLMILGNFMLLCEFDPDEVYRWFMELFIDSYDWVMVPNIYGMSQFSDGGTFATKPYISGSNYILKMSDYPKGDWQKIWDGLFWNFLHTHRDFFLKNPRLSMLVRNFEKMEPDKQNKHLKTAEQFLGNLDRRQK